MSRPGLMSPAAAEEWLGLPRSRNGRRLRDLALRREHETGVRFMQRRGGKDQPRYLLGREAIRRYLPELWQHRFDRIAGRVIAAIDAIKDRIDAVIDERIETHPVVHELQKRSDETIELVESLAGQVRRLSSTTEKRRKVTARDQVGTETGPARC